MGGGSNRVGGWGVVGGHNIGVLNEVGRRMESRGQVWALLGPP